MVFTQQYHNLLQRILDEGTWRDDPNRKGVRRLQVPFANMVIDMGKGFPAITSKPLYWKGVVTELLWFLRGDTDIKYLHDHNVHIWDEDWKRWGKNNLGRIYGAQWRQWDEIHHFLGYDQIKDLIAVLKTNPLSSSMVINSWNPVEFDHMALPPCHWSFQVTCEPYDVKWQLPGQDVIFERKGYFLDLIFNMRSNDVLLGLPFNIASYALLAHILCKMTGKDFLPRLLVYNGTNVHLYDNQIEVAKQQLKRKVSPVLPVLDLPNKISLKDIDKGKITPDQFILTDYYPDEPLPKVKMLTYDK